MHLRSAIVSLIFAALALGLKAQEKEYLYEIGLGGGMSWGYGDINQSKAVYSPALAADLLFRYNVNLRWAVAVDLSTNGVKGSSSDFDAAMPGGFRYDYDRRLWQLAVRPEFNFWNYGFGADYREKKSLAPFLTMGIGLGLSTGDVTIDNAGARTVEDGSDFSFNIPMGVGVKWKMAPRWNTQLTCLFTKSFGDRVDGISQLPAIKTSRLMKNDWLGSLLLSVTFDFRERCVECHNQANKMLW